MAIFNKISQETCINTICHITECSPSEFLTFHLPCLPTIFEQAFATRKSNLPLGGASTRLMSLPSFRVKARSYFDPIICYIAASVFAPGLVTFILVVYWATVWDIFQEIFDKRALYFIDKYLNKAISTYLRSNCNQLL